VRQALGDGVQAPAGDVLGEDPAHDGRRCEVRLEAVEPLADRRLAGFGCGPASASW
jgi:hypothetical protein